MVEDARKEVEHLVKLLSVFKADIKKWFDGQYSESNREEFRSSILQRVPQVREIVGNAGVAKSYTIAPPPMIGGLVAQNIDPFCDLLGDHYGQSLIPPVIDTLDEAIGVIRSPAFLAGKEEAGSKLYLMASALDRVERICHRFPLVARQLQDRYGGRSAHSIDDEYDVQDLLHALLRLDFDDVRAEEYTPSYAGGASRVDFLLKRERVVIEVKKTRKGLGAREVGDQLIIDIDRYKSHPDCGALVCFVYDVEHKIGNPSELQDDLSCVQDGRDIRIIVAPT